MSMKKKQVRGTEGYKYTHEENRGNGHYHYVHLFLGMSLAVVCFMLLFAGIGVVSAQPVITYDSGTRTITIASGTAYPQDIADAIGDPDVFVCTGTTSIMAASLTINEGAELIIEGETFKFDCSSDGEFGITSDGGTLSINNSIITSVNPDYHGWIESVGTGYVFTLRNSDVSHLGANPHFAINLYGTATSPPIIDNNEMYSFSHAGIQIWTGPSGEIGATISNNTMHDWSLQTGIKMLGGYSDAYLVLDSNEIYNCPNAGYLICGGGKYKAINNVIHDCPLDTSPMVVIRSKEGYGGAIIKNNTIYNFKNGVGIAILNSFGQGCEYPPDSWVEIPDRILCTVEDNVIYNVGGRGVSRGILFQGWGSDYSTVSNNEVYECSTGIDMLNYAHDIYLENNTVHDNDVGVRFVSTRENNTFFDTELYNNGKDINVQSCGDGVPPKFINTLYSIVDLVSTPKFLVYQLLDVRIEDTNGNSIEGAAITITNEVDSNYPSINVNGENRTSFVTGADGHTPLPSDPENSAAISDFWQTKTVKGEMIYTIIAEKDGYSNSTTVNPDSFSWYRSDQDTYQNTITLVLETGTDTTPPTITAHSPTGTGIFLNTNISVTFSEAMNTSSAQGAFSIFPHVSGSLSWNGNKMTYTTGSDLSYGTAYTVTIGTEAEDLAGNNLKSPYSWEFTTVELDTSPPVISSVNVTSITGSSATITWDTNEEADTKVTYDANPANLGTIWQNNSVLTKTHSITLTGLDDDKTYYYKVYSTDASWNTANSTTFEFTTLPVLPGNGTVLIQAQGDVTDNRLKEASPDTVLGSTNFIDVGRIDSVGNYRDVIWFDLSQLNSTDVIKTAKLSLFWYFEATRNSSTTVEIYRPVDWAETYVTWNSRTDGVGWTNAGGDWYDRNIVAQGNTPYAAVTLPLGALDNAYHEFDVTELVQSYVSGLYENTGFFIKTNEVSDSYIAFRSSDWTNADERPKLVVSYGSGDAQQNTLSGAVTSPDSAGIAGANVTLATLEGTVINTTQTDSNGNYSFTEISAGTYNLTVTKPRFWPATNITVTTGNTEDVMLWLKGDLNLNGTQADSGDLLMMGYAATGGLTPDWKFDLNGNGEDACAGDLLMLEDAAAGKIELW